MSVRVLVVDDHAVVRAGLKLLLDSAEGIQIAGESGTAGEALTAALPREHDERHRKEYDQRGDGERSLFRHAPDLRRERNRRASRA
jgi:hypothetical protein